MDGQNNNRAAPTNNDILPKKPELQQPHARRQKSTNFVIERGAAAVNGGDPQDKA